MIESGQFAADIDKVSGLIRAGLKRLDSFRQEDGMYALWEGGNPGAKISAKVAHRLMVLRELPFEGIGEKLEKTKHALLKEKVKDNQLLPLDSGFKDGLNSIKDAVAFYFENNGQRQNSLDFIHKQAIRDGSSVHWDGSPSIGYWGGKLEATCDAARVLHDAKDPLFGAAFNYIGGQLVDGRLFSTADTRALIELLSAMNLENPTPVVEVDGVLQQIDRPIQGQTVKAVDSDLLVRIDREIEVDYLKPQDNFRFKLETSNSKVKLGDRVTITITAQEETLCPVARVFLPGNLALIEGGANAQTAYRPIKQTGGRGMFFSSHGQLTLEAVAVRRGSGGLNVMVHDLYDAEKIGTAKPLQIVVV